jgi:hypothetical protein
MKKLKAVNIDYHRDLLLAIVKGRPSFGSAYLEEFPYNLEDYASPSWSDFCIVLHTPYLYSFVFFIISFLFHLLLHIYIATEAAAGFLLFLWQQT